MANRTRSILIVEDDLDTREMLRRLLAQEGYTVHVAADGWDGLLTVNGTAPDLNPVASNPTLEVNGGDVRHETDFRSFFAAIADQWLRTDSTVLLQGNFRDAKLNLVV